MGQTEVKIPPEALRQILYKSLSSGLEELIAEAKEEGISVPFDSIKPEGHEEDIRDYLKLPTEEQNWDISQVFIYFFMQLREKVREDSTLEELLEVQKTLENIQESVDLILQSNTDRDPEQKKYRVFLQLNKQTPPEQSLTAFALDSIKEIRKKPKPERIPLPKDLMDTQVNSVGDTLEYITDPTTKENIQKLQSQGLLLAGTLEGLSGGGAYLKAFTIALAQTLNEQSKYFKTEGDLSGVKNLLEERFKGEVEIVKDSEVPNKRGETEVRPHPYIIAIYEDLADKMRGKGRKRGGRDAEYIREYIDKLSNKQYLLDGGKDSRGRQILAGVPLLIRFQYFYIDGKEVGCLLCLSPQFSSTVRKYTSLRADTIQMIGGGRQKDITMSLLNLLLYVRGVKGGSTWRKNKKELLDKIGGGKTYSGRPGKRETDFKEAIQKVKDCGLILEYKEEESTWGQPISVFKFNPHYIQKEETEIDPQEGVSEE